MRVVTPTDMRQRLGEILDAAASGERILIERDHRPLAMLVSVEDGRRLDEDREERIRRRMEAIDRLAEFRARMAQEHPRAPGALTAAAAVRRDRDRDDERGTR